jgi:hypothetical protein
MRFALTIYIAGLLLLACASTTDRYSVRFTVLNQWGRPHSYRVLHFRSTSEHVDFAPRFHDLESADIPYGNYDYELAPGAGEQTNEDLTGRVSVYRSQIHVTRVLGTTDSLGHLAQFPVAGSLSPMPPGRGPVWVIVENVYGQYRQESTVDDRGAFQFDFIWGNNVVIVCAGSEVLMAGPLVLRRDEMIRNMRIDLRTHAIQTSF